VLIGNPIIVMIIMGVMGYRKKVSFKAGLTVAQISEFSLILIALGASQGQIGSDVVGLVTAVGLITIAASTYLIYGSDAIYARIEPALRIFERKVDLVDPNFDDDHHDPEYVVIGLGRFGSKLVAELIARGVDVLGVDFDPRSVQTPRFEIPVVYGDAEDPTLIDQLPLTSAAWVVSTVRSLDANLTLITSLRRSGYAGRIAVASEDAAHCALFTAAGADVTVQPLHIAAVPLLERILEHDADRETDPASTATHDTVDIEDGSGPVSP
jgi:voltage-gated potassium channel Kch